MTTWDINIFELFKLNDNINLEEFTEKLLEGPLCIQVFMSQIQAKQWQRNGYLEVIYFLFIKNFFIFFIRNYLLFIEILLFLNFILSNFF